MASMATALHIGCQLPPGGATLRGAVHVGTPVASPAETRTARCNLALPRLAYVFASQLSALSLPGAGIVAWVRTPDESARRIPLSP